MIVFEFNESDEVLEIHGTPEDLTSLSSVLAALAERVGEHEHLMTPSWSGDELGEKPVCKQDVLVNHVKISCWKAIPSEE